MDGRLGGGGTARVVCAIGGNGVRMGWLGGGTEELPIGGLTEPAGLVFGAGRRGCGGGEGAAFASGVSAACAAGSSFVGLRVFAYAIIAFSITSSIGMPSSLAVLSSVTQRCSRHRKVRGLRGPFVILDVGILIHTASRLTDLVSCKSHFRRAMRGYLSQFRPTLL